MAPRLQSATAWDEQITAVDEAEAFTPFVRGMYFSPYKQYRRTRGDVVYSVRGTLTLLVEGNKKKFQFNGTYPSYAERQKAISQLMDPGGIINMQLTLSQHRSWEMVEG